MLAATYGEDKKHTKDLTFPAYVSPKIDGFRALIVDGKVQSRSGKLIPNPTTAQDLMQRCGQFLNAYKFAYPVIRMRVRVIPSLNWPAGTSISGTRSQPQITYSFDFAKKLDTPNCNFDNQPCP